MDILDLLRNIVGSFESRTNIKSSVLEDSATSFCKGGIRKGLPLGNLTSQLLVNVYMNEFDQFVKHKLKCKYYIRYADDFMIFSDDKNRLEKIVRYIVQFLCEKLRLELHPDKVFIKTLSSGVDFLGWVHFPDHRLLRTTTKRRMFRRLAGNPKEETVASYRGLLSHGNTRKLQSALNKLEEVLE